MTGFLHAAGLALDGLMAAGALAAVILGVTALIRVGPEFPRRD